VEVFENFTLIFMGVTSSMPKETKVLSYIGFRNIISHCVFGYISNQEGRRKFVYMYVQQSDGNSEAKQKPDPLAGQCLFAASW